MARASVSGGAAAPAAPAAGKSLSKAPLHAARASPGRHNGEGLLFEKNWAWICASVWAAEVGSGSDPGTSVKA
jgi:hypothetical protein